MSRQVSPLGLPLRYSIDAVADLTGAASAGQAGTVTVTFDFSGPVTGVAIAGEAGTVSVNNANAIITGAATAGEAGSVASVSADRQTRLGPHGLPFNYQASTDVNANVTGAESLGEAGTPSNPDISFSIPGAASAVEAGVVSASVQGVVKGQLGPLILPGKRRLAAIQEETDAVVPITGAEIRGQSSHPDLSDITIYADGADSFGFGERIEVNEGGGVYVDVTGAEAAADAGTVTVDLLTEATIAGAEIATEVGNAQSDVGVGGSITAAVSGVASAGEAGSVTTTYDWAQPLVGAVIGIEASEPGVDTSADVSPTITGVAANMLTSGVGFVNLYANPVVGAAIQAQANEIASGFGDEDLGISDSTDRFNGVVASMAVKVPCRTATTSNITLSGSQLINGLQLVTGDRVLVAGQTNPVENGIYVVDSSAWERAADFDGNRDIVRGTLITITNE